MPIGLAKVDITPDTPVRMYGYAGRTTESEGIAGRLKATALALGGDEGEGPAVLLSVDCGAVPAQIHDAVLQRVQKACGLKSERFMLCNSHNHSGPDLKGMDSMTGTQHEHLVVVVDYALRLRRELDGSRLWINAYARDVSGYIVSDRLLGEGGYEVHNSVSALVTYGKPETLKPSMEDRIIARVRDLLPESFRRPR